MICHLYSLINKTHANTDINTHGNAVPEEPPGEVGVAVDGDGGVVSLPGLLVWAWQEGVAGEGPTTSQNKHRVPCRPWRHLWRRRGENGSIIIV